jgi:hypothetical protein
MILQDHISPTFKFQKPAHQCPFILQKPSCLYKGSLAITRIENIEDIHITQNITKCTQEAGKIYMGKLTNLADTRMPSLHNAVPLYSQCHIFRFLLCYSHQLNHPVAQAYFFGESE